VQSINGTTLPNGAWKLSWQLLNEQNKTVNEGAVILDGTDTAQLKNWRWPKMVAENINRANSPLKAGAQDAENKAITPADSRYQNELWLPKSLVDKGYSVTLNQQPLAADELPKPEWILAKSDKGDDLYIDSESVGALKPGEKINLVINHGKPIVFTPQSDRLGKFHWSHDLAEFINKQGKSAGVMAGEKGADGVTPLVSQYRNRIWVKESTTTVSYTITAAN